MAVSLKIDVGKKVCGARTLGRPMRWGAFENPGKVTCAGSGRITYESCKYSGEFRLLDKWVSCFLFLAWCAVLCFSAETARDADTRHINVEARLFCVGEAVGRIGQSRDANAGFSCC